MAVALEEILARFSIDDRATKNLKKMDRTVDKTTTGLEKAEKQTEDTQRAFKKLGRGTATRSHNVGGGGGGGGRGGGGTLSGIAGAMAGFGALIAIPLMAMKSVAQRFEQGISVKGEVRQVAADFSNAFGKKLRVSLDTVDTFFDNQDLRKAFTGLAETGIDPSLIERSSKNLSAFAKAQGFTSMGQAVQALTSGQVKYGRGLDETSIRQIQGLVPALQQGGEAANIAFREISQILERNQKPLQENAKQTERFTGKVQRQQNEIIRTNRDMAIEATKPGLTGQDPMEAYRSAKMVERGYNRIEQALGSGAGTAVRKATEFAEDKMDIKVPGRAAGGRVNTGSIYEINEGNRKREYFQPLAPGKVVTNNDLQNKMSAQEKSGNNKSSIIITVPITVNATGNNTARQTAQTMRREIRRTLDEMARNDFRQQSALPMRG